MFLSTAFACAHDLHLHYPGDGDASLDMRLTAAVSDTSVAINGQLLAEGERTRRILVDHMPTGESTVVLAASDLPEKTFTIDLQPGQHAVMPLSAPAEASIGSAIGSLFFQAIAAGVAYAAYMAVKSL
jgi:hypothetical protein